MTTPRSLRQTIVEIEQRRIEAMIKKDVATLAELLADELSYVHSGGRSDNKAAFVELIGSPTSNYLGVDYFNTEVLACGDECAIVRGVARLHLGPRANGPETTYSVLFTDAYVLRDGRWQMIAWHATRLPE